MTHVRTQVRAWLQNGLAGSVDAGSRVFQRRALPLPKDLLPTLIFSVQNERSTDVAMGGTQERRLTVRVTACAKGDANSTEDILDRMALFVENVFSANPTMAGLIKDYTYQSAEYAFVGEAEKTLCTLALTFVLTLYTVNTDPQTSI